MKAASAALASHLAQSTTTLATCWKVKRRDGTILGFTDHDRDLPVDLGDGDGTISYMAATGYKRTGIKAVGDLNVAKLHGTGLERGHLVTIVAQCFFENPAH